MGMGYLALLLCSWELLYRQNRGYATYRVVTLTAHLASTVYNKHGIAQS